ncbi:MAG: hypothetical protein SAL70_09575 [Scytonema sp. PMC 1070.18]|nr:hypothetical protein [Scytonema sp. PMC 1070.18]
MNNLLIDLSIFYLIASHGRRSKADYEGFIVVSASITHTRVIAKLGDRSTDY